jgi:hypothetical protein
VDCGDRLGEPIDASCGEGLGGEVDPAEGLGVATTMVERLIRMAPTAGERVIPAKASTPAARGMATML